MSRPPSVHKRTRMRLTMIGAGSRCSAIRTHADREQPDVWVFTETHDEFTPGHSFSHSSAPGRDGHHVPEHRWATIWSVHPLEPARHIRSRANGGGSSKA